MIFDSHCHIQFKAYDNDRDEIIKRALDAGVKMITVGTDFETSKLALDVTKTNDGVWATVGLHPNHLFEYPHDTDEEEKMSVENFNYENYRKLASDKKVAAIGECGLDFFRIPKNLNAGEVKEKQEKVLRQHLDLADELNLPIVIHCRDAHQETFEILKEYSDNGKLARRGVIHCFTGTLEEAKKYISIDFYISFTGIITFPPRKNQVETLADVVKSLPLEKILVETDAPYLAPEPYRGKRNEPLFVVEITKKIAELHGISIEIVAEKTTANVKKLFGIEN